MTQGDAGKATAIVAFVLLGATAILDRFRWRRSPIDSGGITLAQVLWRVGLLVLAIGFGLRYLV